MAVPPRSVASWEASAPPIFPNGVRAVPRITVVDIGAFLRRAAPAAEGAVEMLEKRRQEPAIDSPPVDLEVVAKPLAEIDVDLAAVGLADGDQLPAELAGAPGASDAKTAKGKLALLHPQRPSTALVVGLGDPSEVDRERLRVAAAKVAKRAGDHDASSVAWLIPSVTSLGAPDVAQAI